MDNGGARESIGHGGPSWDLWGMQNWPSNAAFSHRSSSASCSPFADSAAAVVPTAVGGGGDHHHLTCLKLGKRQYYGAEGTSATTASIGAKRPPPPPPPVPRCQVEGCDRPLADAKDYHRRHKVCESHSKAPRVVVHGAEQRFCQQCSRFHAIAEFDESKRSCRRRLAGHNERRRKSSVGVNAGESIMRIPQSLGSSTATGNRFTYESSPGCALSLLSSEASPWFSMSDIPSRSSAALRELIAENRAAAILTGQLFTDRPNWHDVSPGKLYMPHQDHAQPQAPAQLTNGWNQFRDSGSHL